MESPRQSTVIELLDSSDEEELQRTLAISAAEAGDWVPPPRAAPAGGPQPQSGSRQHLRQQRRRQHPPPQHRQGVDSHPREAPPPLPAQRCGSRKAQCPGSAGAAVQNFQSGVQVLLKQPLPPQDGICAPRGGRQLELQTDTADSGVAVLSPLPPRRCSQGEHLPLPSALPFSL